MKRLFPLVVSLAVGSAIAQPTTPTTTTTPTSTVSAQYLQKASRFQSLAGSQENLSSLVTGLRTGSEINLGGATTTTPPASPPVGGTTTPPPAPSGLAFTSPTKPMGYGNITRALDLAQRQLAAAGMTNPTPEQLKTALMGGSLTTAGGSVETRGILQLRAEGMGWGRIAHTVGVHPGMGKAAPATTTAAAGPSSTVKGSRITTAAGTTLVHGKPSHTASAAAPARGHGALHGSANAGGNGGGGGRGPK